MLRIISDGQKIIFRHFWKYEIFMNSEIFQVQKKYLGEKIKNAQNRLRCPENYFLGIFENMKFSWILKFFKSRKNI